MSNLTSLNVKIDSTLKKEADTIANSIGMTLSTAVNIFVHQMVSERAMPFKVQMADMVTEELEQIRQRRLSAKAA